MMTKFKKWNIFEDNSISFCKMLSDKGVKK